MSDRTELFKKYLDLIIGTNTSQSLDESEKTNGQFLKHLDKYTIKDTFVKECVELLAHISELIKIVSILENEYEDEYKMDNQERDNFDMETRLQLHQYIEKFKYLKEYETRRQKLIKSEYSSNNSSLLGFLTSKSQDMVMFYCTTNQHRNGILQFLNMSLGNLSSKLSNIQHQRLKFQYEWEPVNHNSSLSVPSDFHITVSHSENTESTYVQAKEFEVIMKKLSQEQLQTLETEHDEILNYKDNELKKIKKINQTVIEIASLQNELGNHIHAQTQNINTLLDNNELIGVNINQGNFQLKKAQALSSKSTKSIIYLSIAFALLIIFLDYIN